MVRFRIKVRGPYKRKRIKTPRNKRLYRFAKRSKRKNRKNYKRVCI